MNDILLAIQKITSMQSFWTVMSYATMTAMFFGTAIYDGAVPHAKKGIASVASYIFMAMVVTLNYSFRRYYVVESAVKYQLLIFPIQLLFISFFWFIGFILGIAIHRVFTRRK